MKPFIASLVIVASLFWAFEAHAQIVNQQRNIIPALDSEYYLGTTTGATGLRSWLRVIADSFYDTDASDGCATWSSNVLTSTGVACGSGSGSGGGLGTTTPWTAGDLVQVVNNGSVTSIATSSLKLETSSFLSPNISQWTNNSGYVTYPWPFTKLSTNEQATSTIMGFLGGFISNASSTVNGSLFANGNLRLPVSGFVGFAGSTAVDSTNYSLFGNTTLTLLNARSGASIGFRINNTDVANFSTTGGFGFGNTYYNLDPGQNNMIVEGNLGVGSSTPFYALAVGDNFSVSSTGNSTTTNATTTDLHVSSDFNFGGVTGNSWDDYCLSITGAAGLCDGSDATGSGGAGLATSTNIADTEVIWGTSASDVGSEPAFTYNDATNLLTVDNILAMGSTTLQNFTGQNATTTNATTTSLAISTLTSTRIPVISTGGALIDSPALTFTKGTPQLVLTKDDSGLTPVLQMANSSTGDASAFFTTAGGADWAIGIDRSASHSFKIDNTVTFGTGGDFTLDTSGLLTLGGTLLVNGSTTLQNFTGVNATTTNATTTSLAVTNLSAANCDLKALTTGVVYCGTDANSGGGSFAWPFTKQAGNEQATSTIIEFVGGLLSNASSTFTGSTTLATTLMTNATSSNFAVTDGFILSGITSAIPLTNTVGQVSEYAGTSCTNQFVRSLSALGAATCATVANTDLANSTISGISLGSNLNSLSNGSTLLGTSYNGSATVSDWDIDLNNGNVWTTASTTFVGGVTIGTATTTSATTSAFAISGITSAIPLTNAQGSVAEYAGTSCTNQLIRSLSALGVATCATIVGTDVDLADLTATNGTLTFSGTYDGQTARTIGLNLANANNWTALQTFTNSTSTNFSSTYASTSQLRVDGSITFNGVTGSTWASFCSTITGSADLCDGSDDGAGGGGGNSKFATSTNSLFVYPNGGGAIGFSFGGTPSATTTADLYFDSQVTEAVFENTGTSTSATVEATTRMIIPKAATCADTLQGALCIDTTTGRLWTGTSTGVMSQHQSHSASSLCTYNITADAASALTVSDCEAMSLDSDNTTSTSRTFCLLAGYEGQRLTLFADVTSTDEIELGDGAAGACAGSTGAATALAGVWPATTNQNNDVLNLVYHGTTWFEISRAAN